MSKDIFNACCESDLQDYYTVCLKQVEDGLNIATSKRIVQIDSQKIPKLKFLYFTRLP